jgi:hypothetical protein
MPVVDTPNSLARPGMTVVMDRPTTLLAEHKPTAGSSPTAARRSRATLPS